MSESFVESFIIAFISSLLVAYICSRVKKKWDLKSKPKVQGDSDSKHDSIHHDSKIVSISTICDDTMARNAVKVKL